MESYRAARDIKYPKPADNPPTRAAPASTGNVTGAVRANKVAAPAPIITAVPKPTAVEAPSPIPLFRATSSAITPAGAPTNPPTAAGPGDLAPMAAAVINLGNPNLKAIGTIASAANMPSGAPCTI